MAFWLDLSKRATFTERKLTERNVLANAKRLGISPKRAQMVLGSRCSAILQDRHANPLDALNARQRATSKA